MKKSNSLEVAEYVAANKLQKKPVFAWWIAHTVRKRTKIICDVKQIVKIMHEKYGFGIPKNIIEAYWIDTENKNTMWRDAINRKMRNIVTSFKILEGGKKPSLRHKLVWLHLIFDVTMNFTCKTKYVVECCSNPEPVNSIYTEAVSQESDCIVLTYATIRDLNIWAKDDQNSYLQALCSETYYIKCGPEFGS